MKELPELLRQYRKKRGLAQKEVAAILGISREHYTRIERGLVTPSQKLSTVIAEKLNITLVTRWSLRPRATPKR